MQSPDRIACSGGIFEGSIPLQEQVQALRDDNVALAAALAAATDALPAQAERAQRAEAALQARLEDARTGAAAAQERSQEARRERDFLMTQSTEAAALAAAAVADREAASQVRRFLHSALSSYPPLKAASVQRNISCNTRCLENDCSRLLIG